MTPRLPWVLIGIALGVVSLASSRAARSGEFTYPQGVYEGEAIELGEYPSGGVVNAALLERISRTQPTEPYTVEITDGVWALVGYHWSYRATATSSRSSPSRDSTRSSPSPLGPCREVSRS